MTQIRHGLVKSRGHVGWVKTQLDAALMKSAPCQWFSLPLPVGTHQARRLDEIDGLVSHFLVRGSYELHAIFPELIDDMALADDLSIHDSAFACT